MRRLIIGVLALLLALNLAACGGKQDAPTWQEQYDLGIRYLSEGSYEEAVIAFTAAIEIDPKQAETYKKLADVYIALGDRDAAEAVLQQGYEETGDETLMQAYYSILRTDDELYKQLSESYLDFLENLTAAVIAQDSQTALSMQTSQTCAELIAMLPLDESGTRYSLTFYPTDSMSVNFFREADESATESHIDIYSGLAGNGEVYVSVFNGSLYYMRNEMFSGGTANGEATEHVVQWYDGGSSTLSYTKTGTIQNGETVGQILYTYDDGTSYYLDDSFHVPPWPTALN